MRNTLGLSCWRSPRCSPALAVPKPTGESPRLSTAGPPASRSRRSAGSPAPRRRPRLPPPRPQHPPARQPRDRPVRVRHLSEPAILRLDAVICPIHCRNPSARCWDTTAGWRALPCCPIRSPPHQATRQCRAGRHAGGQSYTSCEEVPMIRRATLAAGALALLLGAVQPAWAIPPFARKYGVSCSMCHAPAPRLTAFGERFAENGFEMMPGEPPRDTVQTGDPLLRLPRGVPLGVRIDAYAQ